ncbi:MAG: hypothetical protein JWL71_5199 [Acidobacteria bacterium]|nr:hypothetical protein [Acidobacteriota bacterium]
MMRKTAILFAVALGAAGMARADDVPKPPHCLKKCRVVKASASSAAPKPLRHNDMGHARASDYFGPDKPAPNDPPPR